VSKRGLSLSFATPALLNGGTQVSAGCPLLPPMPVEEVGCHDWHIELPDLDSNSTFEALKGDDITVIILDAFPERGIISRAAEDAGETNKLLESVDAQAIFDYSLMSAVDEMKVMENTNNAGVGKDVYGRHYQIQLPDHGLFIAGIIHDIAPRASIECIRILDDLCVGDQIIPTLEKILARMTVDPVT